MSNLQFHHFLLRLRRSALFRSRSLLLASSTALLAVLFFSVSLILSATSRQASPEHRSASTIHTLFKSIGLASDDELGLNDESDKVTLDEGENDPAHRIEKRILKRGESIYTILTAAGMTPSEVQELSSQLKGNPALKGLKAGKSYEFETGGNGKFIRFSVQSSPSEMLHIVRDEQSGKLSAERETIEYDTRVATLEGTLHSSLSSELRSRNRASLNPKIKKILASRIDFKKDIHPGATYRVLFQEKWDESRCIDTGDILAIEISSKGQKFNAYQFTNAKGDIAYYDEKGRAMMQGRAMFVRPCSYRRVSSGFGYRIHPVTGQRQFHGGIDLAAPVGTPVRAVADGRVIFRGRKGNAGNLVTIAHGGGLHTMYMHLSRYAPGSRYGKQVKQGDIIGYVGSTGRTTGPHLDFRIIRSGRPQNPLVALKQAAPRRSLSRAELHSFIARVQTYERQLDSERPVMVADVGKSGEPVL
ncbi:MAG: peptidoglycan DD-metalloendopeptidase family protein [Chlorobaculum sp.]